DPGRFVDVGGQEGRRAYRHDILIATVSGAGRRFVTVRRHLPRGAELARRVSCAGAAPAALCIRYPSIGWYDPATSSPPRWRRSSTSTTTRRSGCCSKIHCSAPDTPPLERATCRTRSNPCRTAESI